jgi:hypothetical protein
MNENFQWMHNCIYDFIREFLKYLDEYALCISSETGLKCHIRPTLVQEHPAAHALECPSLRRTHLLGNLPLQL